MKIFVVGVKKFRVEMNTKYIKGMINNPDAHPNAAMNHWIAAILLFDFELIHVPGKKFEGPDGLSRREKTEDKGDTTEEEAENWVDEILGCGIWVAGSFYAATLNMGEEDGQKATVASAMKTETKVEEEEIPETEESRKRDEELMVVMKFLATMEKPESLDKKGIKTLVARATRYFISGG